MAEITKITTPMMPKENTSIKHKPVTDQAFELTDPGKVHKPDNEGSIKDRQPDTATLLKDSMGRPAVAPLLRNPSEMMQAFKKIAFLIEMGVSASDASKDEATRELLESLFVSPKQVAGVLDEQDKSSVLFKGEAFDVLRDIASKFGDYPKVKDAIANLLKTFEYNVNTQNSVNTILNNCNNLLDYMFSRDRSQFAGYIADLAQMVMPGDEAAGFIGKMADILFPQHTQQPQAQEQVQVQTQEQNGLPQNIDQQSDSQATAQGSVPNQVQNPQNSQNLQDPQSPQTMPDVPAQKNIENPQSAAQGEATGQTQSSQQPNGAGQAQQQAGEVYDPVNQGLNTQKFEHELYQTARRTASQTGTDAQTPQLSQRETAQILKNNLLPLLSEIVVKYNQSDKIRDTVMVVVHNIVRVDKGTPEALREAVNKLVDELKDAANIPKAFEKQLRQAIEQSVKDVKSQPNNIMSKMTDLVSEALRSPDTNPAVLRQAESMLVSMLQNQNPMMNILHFIIPFQTPQGQVFTELYVDPETEESVGRQKGKSHKIFLSVESEAHGSFELSFLETNDHVDFAMWVPEELVQSLSGLKKNFSNIMQLHGYTMNTFKVDEMKAPHTVAEVFPRLIEKKVGIDFHA